LNAGGSLVMFAGGGMTAKAAKLGEVLPVAMMGATQNAGSEYKRAYDMATDARNLSDEDYYAQYGNNMPMDEVIAQKNQLAQQNPEEVAFSVMPGAAAVGSLEGLPIGSFLKRMDGVTCGLFQKALGKQVAKIGITGQATMGAI
ncbi:hypothetical protein RXP96_29830, partial [Pseudomonas aeruginosa]|nr:hypothetical protein [Pseudomonas aeruginosa]